MTDIASLKALAEKATPHDGYTIDADGAVWSHIPWRGQSRRQLTTFPNSHGYPAVKVKTPSGSKKALVHVMVCEAFHGSRPSPEHQVRHLNGDKSDNRAANLAWGTAKENAADRSSHGTCRAAENGKASAEKLRARPKKTHCLRGHDKEGRITCEECRREKRRAARTGGLA